MEIVSVDLREIETLLSWQLGFEGLLFLLDGTLLSFDVDIGNVDAASNLRETSSLFSWS